MFNSFRSAMIALALIFAFAAMSSPAGAEAPRPRLSLEGATGDLTVGTVSDIRVLVRGAPPVAGVQLVIKYDPAQVRVIDTDPKIAGSQATHGAFFNAQKDFFAVRNDADAKTGELNYVVSALYPAKESQGDGQILTFRVAPSRPGDSVISIASARFGDFAGKSWDVVLGEPLKLHASPGKIGFLAQIDSEQSAPVSQGAPRWLLILAAGAALLVIGGVAFWFGRRTRQATT